NTNLGQPRASPRCQGSSRCCESKSVLAFLPVGIIYDVIVEPPSVGSMTDEHGHQRPVAFLAYRVNGQYIMEGLASSFLFTMGGLGFIILDRSNAPNIPKLNRFLLLFIGFVSVLLSFFMARVFMRMKLPGYLMG
ncbi:PREDICTED: oligosaccharyltransferase complex subunit OSTC, partial [Corvus brachyrhynchos]|uniref:oligosaccharyltransferase complex subunit OSTC n=1 Tax=Corvus brachyrhynchos TaxID=85066 RepID=UPI0008166EA8